MIIDLVGGTGGSAFTINKNHIFTDNTARDSYFALNPTEKEDGVLISVGSGYQEYNGVNWIEKSSILKGNKGDKGDKGDTGEQGLQGIQGETGNGVSTIIKTGTVGLVDTYTITFTDRTTTTFDITNGLNGTNGVDGQDINHVSKTAGTSAPGITDTYTVWGDLGETINLGTFTVYNGVNGGGPVDLSEYYKKTETYSKVEVDTKIADIPPTDLTNYYNKTETETLLSNKQDNLVSGTNIKTINGQSVLGNGNVVITAESASPLNVPVITSPTNGAVDYIGSITSTYTTSQSYVGVQDWVRWEAGTDENFTNIIDSYEGSDNLTNWTPAIGGLDITTIYVRTKQGSDNHLSSWSDTISFTTPDIYVENPTITVDGTPNDVLKNPTISGSAFSVYGGTDTHESTDYQVVRVSDGVVVWESLGNTVDKTSIRTGDLEESTAYIFKMRYNSESYGSSNWVETTGTTKAVFNIPIGVQGKKGFGVAPTDLPFAVLGLAEMTGTNDPESDNYGNYIHTNGSIVCWCPKGYYRVGSSESPRFATYGANALDIVGIETFSTTVEANTAGYALHRAFINAGAEQSGFFIDKYMNSKDGNTTSKSVFGGVPISLATTAGYTVSNGMTGCTGILADAVVLSKARGTRWNTATAFMYGYLAMVSVAQAQSATSTEDVAWYDPTGVNNFPKGCNNNALSDINDTSVVYVTAGDSGNANKPKTGATVGFTKTTHNGSANGVADLNGGMWEVTIGITNFGTSATDTASITTDQIYVLKQSVDVATLTGGWDTTNDVWGNTTNLATKYDLVTSPHPLGSSTGNVNWGNGSNAVFQNDLSGVNRDVCGFIPKNASSTSATGSNLFGNDYLNKNNKGNLVPIACGYWNDSAVAGVFGRYFNYGRSLGYFNASFRASAYVAL